MILGQNIFKWPCMNMKTKANLKCRNHYLCQHDNFMLLYKKSLTLTIGQS